MAPAQFERRMMSQMDFTAELTDCCVECVLPFPFLAPLFELFPPACRLAFFFAMFPLFSQSVSGKALAAGPEQASDRHPPATGTP